MRIYDGMRDRARRVFGMGLNIGKEVMGKQQPNMNAR